MRWGVLCGLLAGALWGLVFIVPRVLAGFTPWELMTGRYLAYGAVAAAMLAPQARGIAAGLGRADGIALLRQSLAGNIVYYLLLAHAVQLAGVAPTSLIIGVLPVLVTLMGRADHGAAPLRRLALPLAVVVAGIACINVDVFLHAASTQAPAGRIAAGIACAVGALACWSWYAVDNARYLQRNPRFSSGEWSALYGAASGVLALAGAAAGVALGLIGPAADIVAPPGTSRDWTVFWAVSAGLAIGASLIGNQLWNIANRRVPLTLTGQLIVFETLFALFYGFVWEGQWPRPLEWAAMVLLLTGVAWSVRRHR
ncbi:DMT family transporter [Xylophilus sp.]|uniref:DMT family transporter n=1 Tax=Xylophilus sp. TaxID=2653893 RepID=UPI0013B98C60|nr:DMT family transporter [Xylophilus sp.]KAF1047800.1 MAG: Inner membrane protein YtfF [Xylophilus sp.]